MVAQTNQKAGIWASWPLSFFTHYGAGGKDQCSFGSGSVIVSDIGLPEMDGYDFMRALRKMEGNGTRIWAIALTGYAGAVDESKALNAGYELHFSKPINLRQLAHAIARLSGKT